MGLGSTVANIVTLGGAGRAERAAQDQQRAQERATADILALLGTQRTATQGATDRQLAIMGSAGAAGADALNQGFGDSISGLDNLAALSAIAPSAAQAVGTRDVTGHMPSELQAILGQDPLGAPIEADPAFQFAQQQGEQAIHRANAAQGGRLGGAAMKELAQFNSGLAAQHANTIQNQRLAVRGQDLGAAGSMDAMALQALTNQAGRELQAGLAGQSAQLGLAHVGLGAQAQQSALAQQQGEAIAQLLTGVAGAQAGAVGQGAAAQNALAAQIAAALQGGTSAAGLAEQAAANNQIAGANALFTALGAGAGAAFGGAPGAQAGARIGGSLSGG